MYVCMYNNDMYDDHKLHFASFIPCVISHVHFSSYHFIKMFNRPVDLPLRFIVVCVAETLTFKGKMGQLVQN